MTEKKSMYRVAFDAGLMRPACVILAAALGADPEASRRFPPEDWLLSPTEGMRVYGTTPDQLDRLVGMSRGRGR